MDFNHQHWNEKLLSVPAYSGQFLHSWEWGEFLKALRKPIKRIADEEFLVQLVMENLPFGKKIFYAPKGPVFLRTPPTETWNKISETVRREKKDEIFFRFEPSAAPPKSIRARETKPVQPKQTILVDLSKSEEKLLGDMHEKTRYNIKLAERKGVKINSPNNETAAEIFWKLIKETAERDKFGTHPKEHYQKILQVLSGKPGDKATLSARLFVAEKDGAPLAANIILFFGDMVTYLHGASSGAQRNLMAPYLLHWETMREAKRLGYKFYDLWGIDERCWPGLTRFKRGWGGREVSSAGAWELPLNNFWYSVYSLVKHLRF